VIAPTLKVARLLSDYGVRRPVHVVPTGLDLDRFRPATTEAERADVAALRARLGIGPEQQVVVSVSRLAKEKNLDEVLDHFAALEERAERLGIGDRVRLPGEVDPSEVQRWYRLGDVFVSASLSETQGLTFIEALASGVPLVCRRDPSLAEVILDGRTGWQVDTAEEFVARLGTVLDDARLREQMSAAAIAHAHASCGAESFGRSVLEVYQQSRLPRSPRIIAREAVAA